MLALISTTLIHVTTGRIMNAVQASGVLKKRLFKVAYNSKKHAILNGVYIFNLLDALFPVSLLNLLRFQATIPLQYGTDWSLTK